MSLEGFKITSQGARKILRSEAVRADLQRRADRVKAAAQSRTKRTLVADSYVGRGRAGATVIGVSMREEVDRRILGGALASAR